MSNLKAFIPWACKTFYQGVGDGRDQPFCGNFSGTVRLKTRFEVHFFSLELTSIKKVSEQERGGVYLIQINIKANKIPSDLLYYINFQTIF